MPQMQNLPKTIGWQFFVESFCNERGAQRLKVHQLHTLQRRQTHVAQDDIREVVPNGRQEVCIRIKSKEKTFGHSTVTYPDKSGSLDRCISRLSG